MSQKINPTSFRLGVLQVWNTISATYSNKINFSHFHTKLSLEKYIKCLLEKKDFFIGSLNWTLTNNNVILIITYTKFHNVSNNVRMFKSKLYKILRTKFFLHPKIYLLKNLTWFNSSEFLSAYVNFNIMKGNNFKQVLKNVNKMLSARLNTRKILYTTKGPLLLKLKGFKVKSSGRFDNSRSQMSSSLQYKTGSLPMSKLNNYIEYTQKFIYTKSGVCSLHIWLIFSL